MELVEITPRLSLFRFTVGQSYLWRDGDVLTLVDTGPAGSADEIVSVIEGLGFGASNVARIVLTHWHEDHSGSAGELAERCGASVLAGRADAPVIRGEAAGAPPVLLDWERPLYERVAGTVPPAPPSPVDREVDDGDMIDVGGGARVVGATGHTAGSIGLHLPAAGVLFTGDAVARNERGAMLGVFNADRPAALASFQRLASFDAEIACFGHGAPIIGGAADALRAAASRVVS